MLWELNKLARMAEWLRRRTQANKLAAMLGWPSLVKAGDLRRNERNLLEQSAWVRIPLLATLFFLFQYLPNKTPTPRMR